MIRRRFADLPTRQVHFREAGQGRPLLMLHASPGSSKQLQSKIEVLARSRRVIAPDTPGNGDSAPLPLAAPAIADYADAVLHFLDAVGIDNCDVYGSHTGAHIALDLAVRAPDRCAKLVLDGVGLFSSSEREHYLEHYALPFEPDLIGSQFHRAFMFCRDQYLFWPWFETGAQNRRDGGLPSAQALHDWALEVCKAATTYHLSYRAAFADVSEVNLAKLTQSVLLMVAENDPLLANTEAAGKLVRRGRLANLGHSASVDYLAAFARTMNGFLELGEV